MLREDYREELTALRRHFHRFPELGLKEVKTSGFIREYLEKLGYEITPVPPTGLIAELPALKKKEKLIVLRAEMDGLPITEKTGLSYASCHEGCMHACGHDAILASALIIAKMAADEGGNFPVRLRLLFEPAEEIGEGAKRMMEAGALEEPHADGFLMFHYAADETFGMAVHEGQASSMIGSMEIHVHGKSSHWCEAEKGIDAVYGAALAAEAVHDINRSYRGKGKSLVGIGAVKGGEYANIIADHVVLNGNIRAAREEDFEALKELLKERFREAEKASGTKIEMVFPKEPVYAFANDAGFTGIARKVGTELFGERFILEGEDKLFLFGDNAYRYFRNTRGLFVVFLAAVPGESHPLHHPEFQLDEGVLPYSVEALYEIIKEMSRQK